MPQYNPSTSSQGACCHWRMSPCWSCESHLSCRRPRYPGAWEKPQTWRGHLVGPLRSAPAWTVPKGRWMSYLLRA